MNKKQFYELLKPLVEIYDSIEKDMILDLLERIDNYDGVKGALKWYLDKLNELKVFEKYNVSIVNKNKQEIKKVLEDILEYSTKNTISVDNLENYNKFTNSNITIEDIYNSVSATNLIKEALVSTENICNLINTKAIEAANQEYRNILNTAYLETSTGIYTYTQSIKRAIDKMAENGILMANYDSGRRISIESAVRRDVITRVNQLNGDIELHNAKEVMKTNLVYVSQHLGARTRTKYTKEDYEAHDEWQGKVYMIEGSSDKYPNFYEKTGYKEMLGLKGINCYHHFRPYFEWEKIPEPIDIEESRKEREKLDKMREYERKIRKLKREKIISKKMGYEEDYKKASSKLIKINKEYNEWLDDNNKVHDRNREYVSKNIEGMQIFEDEIFSEFENLDKNREHLIYYDYETGKQIGKTITGEKHSVRPDIKTNIKILFKKENSVVAVHNHPSNTSFSLTDFKTFNNVRAFKGIAVRTDEYIYLLSTGKGSKIKSTSENMKYMDDVFKKITRDMNITHKTSELVHERNRRFAKEMGWKYERIRNQTKI